MMSHQLHSFLLSGLCLLTMCLNGCATAGGRTRVQRPTFGGLPMIQPGVPVQPHSSSRMTVRPGTGLQPTPLTSPGPTIQPGPMLPDAASRKWPTPSPQSASTRHEPAGEELPPIVPRRGAGSSVAKSQQPAALSGGIEIIPGPAIRSHKPLVEFLPPPPTAKLQASDIEIRPSATSKRYEELPPPE